MPSIKCPYCGLVNFNDAAQCKRCQQTISDLTPFAAQRSYQTPTQFSPAQTQAFQSYQMPPPPSFYSNSNQQYHQQNIMPMTCIMCGEHNTSIQTFKKDYVPPVAYLGLLMGLLPAAILILVLKTAHRADVPFCAECWKSYNRGKMLSALSSIGLLFGLIFAIIIGVIAESFFVFFLLFGALSALYYWGYTYTNRVSPKVKKMDGKQIVIDSPIMGEMYFVK